MQNRRILELAEDFDFQYEAEPEPEHEPEVAVETQANPPSPKKTRTGKERYEGPIKSMHTFKHLKGYQRQREWIRPAKPARDIRPYLETVSEDELAELYRNQKNRLEKYGSSSNDGGKLLKLHLEKIVLEISKYFK